MDYWPTDAKIIQVDINPDRIGLTKKVTVGIVGDAKKVAEGILERLSDSAGDAGRQERKDRIAQTKSAWAQELSSIDHEQDDPGTTWNERARDAKPDWMSPRKAWRAIQSALPQRSDHQLGHRQQLRHRQRLSVVRRRPQISGPGPVRPMRLRPACR